MAPEVGFGGVFPCFETIKTEFARVIKRTPAPLPQAVSVRFAGNSAGNRSRCRTCNSLLGTHSHREHELAREKLMSPVRCREAYGVRPRLQVVAETPRDRK